MIGSERFKVHKTEGLARTGEYSTSHGTFQTPNFMPVGTVGTVKGVDCERIREAGAQIVLVNTYHLWLRPTPSVVAQLGGIHKFMGFNGPILSDSGGFQIFSLKGMRRLTEEGVEFHSHLNGEKKFLSPESAINIQEELGVDIAMVLDECPAPDRMKSDLENSLAMTLRWAKRCLLARKKESTSIFGITQGALHQDLRTRSIEGLIAINEEVRTEGARGFDGFAIGGLSVGESKADMYEVLSYHPKELPSSKIRYLMGVGTPEDIITAVSNGVDLFDCVMPTRAGRFGRAFISGDVPWINIRNARFINDTNSLDSRCGCVACRNYSRGYLHHLYRADEMLGPQLLSIHNIWYYQDLMRKIRTSIDNGTFKQVFNEEKGRWAGAAIDQESKTTENGHSGGME